MAKQKKPNRPADYDIGRGKPPKASQFQRGQSGNPGGRKKGCPNLKTLLERVLESEIVVSKQGKPRSVPALEALLLGQVQEALRGRQRSAEYLIELYERYTRGEEAPNEELSSEDLAILAHYLKQPRRGGARPSSSSPMGDPEVPDGV